MNEQNSYSKTFNDFFWEGLPAIVTNKVSGFLGKILFDGRYLSLLKKRTWLLPPILFFIGLLIGANHFGFEKAPYVDSWTIDLMILMLFLSIWGASFGFWLLLGYAIGDLFIFSYQEFTRGGYFVDSNSIISQFLTFFTHYFLPHLILISLLTFLLVLVPITAKKILIRITGQQNMRTIDRALLNIVLYAGICGLLTYCWTKSVPTMISPVYNWIYPVGIGFHCPPPMAQSIFIDNMLLVWASVILSFARFYLEFIYSKRFLKPGREANVISIPFKQERIFSVKAILLMLLSSAFTVLMLSALMLKGSDDNYVSEAWRIGWQSLVISLRLKP